MPRLCSALTAAASGVVLSMAALAPVHAQSSQPNPADQEDLFRLPEAATVFGPSYRRAAVMQIILALAATIAGISAWFLGAASVVCWRCVDLRRYSVHADRDHADEQKAPRQKLLDPVAAK